MPVRLADEGVRIRELDPECTVELRHLAGVRSDGLGLPLSLTVREEDVVGRAY